MAWRGSRARGGFRAPACIAFSSEVEIVTSLSVDKKNSMEIRLSDLTVPRSIKRDRRQFIGGSDARIIISPDERALIRLWKEKRGEAEPEDLSGKLIVRLGVAAEALNQTWPRPLASISLTSLPPGRANELHSPRKTRPRRL